MPFKSPIQRATNMAYCDWYDGRPCKSKGELIKKGFTTKELRKKYRDMYNSYPKQSKLDRRIIYAKNCGKKVASKFGEKIPSNTLSKYATAEEKNAFMEGYRERLKNKAVLHESEFNPAQHLLVGNQPPAPTEPPKRIEAEEESPKSSNQSITPLFSAETTLTLPPPFPVCTTSINATQNAVPQISLNHFSLLFNLIQENTELEKENNEFKNLLAVYNHLFLQQQNLFIQQQLQLRQLQLVNIEQEKSIELHGKINP